MKSRIYKPPKFATARWTGRTRTRTGTGTGSRRRSERPPVRLEAIPDALATLKEHILRLALDADGFDPVSHEAARLYRLVANEAEALAWQTASPLLVFPVLFEEKLLQTRQYLIRQAILRGNSPGALPKPAWLG